MPRDSVKHTFLVAVLLCLVCSLLVSASAVGLRSFQEKNKRRDRQKNILIAAGLYDPNKNTAADVDQLFERVTPKIVDLDKGTFLTEEEAQKILNIKKITDYDQAQASNAPDISYEVAQSEDVASIKRRENYSYVYLVKDGDTVTQMVLPIRGYGLWSTLWGFVAIDAQSLKKGPQYLTIKGLKYYEQKETPGLGGEVDNPNWRAKWPGKHVYDSNWNVQIEVTKGGAHGEYDVDALSGATITSNGVTNMMQFWFGEKGFRPFLKNYSQE